MTARAGTKGLLPHALMQGRAGSVLAQPAPSILQQPRLQCPPGAAIWELLQAFFRAPFLLVARKRRQGMKPMKENLLPAEEGELQREGVLALCSSPAVWGS